MYKQRRGNENSPELIRKFPFPGVSLDSCSLLFSAANKQYQIAEKIISRKNNLTAQVSSSTVNHFFAAAN